MIRGARYVHTNLIAHDWRRLADFYEEHFGCVPVPPERNYSGSTLETGTGVPGATLQGVHLRLPGHGDRGPTLVLRDRSRGEHHRAAIMVLRAAGRRRMRAVTP